MDIRTLSWSEEMCELFGVAISTLPEIHPSCGRFGVLDGEIANADPRLGPVPVSGVLGDQQAALFGQACFEKGMAKATYGTGTFVLLNAGTTCPPPIEGLLTTVAWDLGTHAARSPVSYALEGAVFATGSAVQWLRDGLGVISEAAETGPLAEQVTDTSGVYLVPAFTGLGSPWWDPYARGVIVGLTRGSGREHLARAVVEAMAYQVRDVVDAMRDGGATLEELRVDGGASVMDLLLQVQADQIRVGVTRARCTETTALGAATTAGLAEGVWGSLEELGAMHAAEVDRQPKATAISADSSYSGWRRAVERSLGWAQGQ
jgi:glycerol kinase